VHSGNALAEGACRTTFSSFVKILSEPITIVARQLHVRGSLSGPPQKRTRVKISALRQAPYSNIRQFADA